MECWNNGMMGGGDGNPTFHRSNILNFFLTFFLTTNRRSGYKGDLPLLEEPFFELDNPANSDYKIKTASVH
jgi:hypothetical protein